MTDEDVAPPRGPGCARLRATAGLLGELLITFGIVLLLFVVYSLYVSNWFTAREQADVTARLHNQWGGSRPSIPDGHAANLSHAPAGQQPPQVHGPPPPPGEPFAQLHVPRFGDDYRFTVLEGTDQDTLSAGPGHYADTQLPGQQGNFAVAGHRIGRGAPFNELDELKPCDPIIVETADEWFVYRMLPVPGTDEPRTAQDCGFERAPTGPHKQTVGRRVVEPEQYDAVHPVPGEPLDSVPSSQRARLITLTTCHPEFSAAQRMIVHGKLTEHYPKVPGRPDLRPPEVEQR